MDAVVNMKESVIKDFFNLLEKYKRGKYSQDLSKLKLKVLFIETS